jgi:hypothetical protein
MTADLNVKCTVTKVKEAKEFIKDKEIAKELQKEFKEFEKSIISEKSTSHDKTFIEKQADKPKEIDKPKEVDKPKDFEGKLGDIGGRLGQLGRAQGEGGGLEERLARIESLLGYIEPFIQQTLRPDLSQSAYMGEETQDEPEEHEEE